MFVGVVPAVPTVHRPAVIHAQADVTDADLQRASASRTIALGSPASGGRITTVPLELYVARVLAGEAEPSAPDASLQALAIAIRTFAIVNAGRHRRDGFDVCDTTHCQVPRPATAATRRAALATAGRILTYHGTPAEVFYSASCGGRSESAAEVWPGANLPYLTPVDDDVHDGDAPWTFELSLSQVQQLLRASGFAGHLDDVQITAHDESGRVSRLRLAGLQPDVITGPQFRMAIGPRDLRSTAFSLARRGAQLQFTGRGYGHGVGLCVIGAGRRARRGESAEAILAKYYPGLAIVSLDRTAPPAMEASVTAPLPDAHSTLAAGTAVAAGTAAAPVAASGIVVRVPAASPITASQLERAALAARSRLSKSLGTTVTPISIELHTSLDRFREATGRPWWVSAAVNGRTIDLAPAVVLEQRDGLDTTLLEAMAELFVTRTPGIRPAWVTVGAARYFSRDVPLAPPAAKLRCPSDAELRLAISAAAQHDADARAEACFARAYARSKDWRAVR